MGLLLEAVDVKIDDSAPLRWRWLLRDEETGDPVADHQVTVDPAAVDVARFADLYDYTRSYAAPDRRTEEQQRYMALAGEWAARELLGEPVGAAITEATPVVVRVRVPEALSQVLLWPLELTEVDGRPLAARGDVTFVYDIAPDAAPVRKSDPGGSLRMLAVFAQPTDTSVLALRRERYELTRLVRRIAARERAVVELQVVQYGATRERLREIADSGDGWDVLHLSGHGTGGAFLLEKDDGSPDLVATPDLVALLRPVKRRARLAVVSACESAADTTGQTLRLLGLTEQADALEAEAAGGQAAAEVPGLARALVRELGCAVVAMRYPVTDEFAIAFGEALYTRLLSRTRHHTVDAAVARAVTEAAGPTPTAARPAVSLVTPGVFGSSRVAGLALPVPRGRPVIDPAGQRMAYFPDEPARFVGRAQAMARAGAALAPDSGRTAVLLHGMAGAGKTACALELAYRHQDSFAAAAFWQAPTRDDEWAGALADFANRLDIQLADYGFTMAGHIGTVAALEAFLPRLRAVMAASGVLLVLDNLETLLTPDGGWRDDRWASLVGALTSHGGESRVIMTSRVVPASGTGAPVRAVPVHALSRDEALGLARELPNLRALLHTDGGPLRAGPGTGQEAEAERQRMAADRHQVRRVLRVVQGHPKLLELADAAAADRDRLDAQLAAAEAAATVQSPPGRSDAKTAGDTAAGRSPASQLDAFFRDGHTDLDAAQFLDALARWTTGALDALSPAARLMAEFVSCLEDDDRVSYVIEDNWADLWQRLDRPGTAPAPRPLMDCLAAAALVEAAFVEAAFVEAGLVRLSGSHEQPDTENEAGSGDANEAGPADAAGSGDEIAAEDKTGAWDGPAPVAYRVHPGVAAAITTQAGQAVREAADAELAAFWEAVSDQGREREGGEDGALVVWAGLAAAPYLLRRGDWDTAAFLLEQAVQRDRSPGTAAKVLPSLRRIAAATGKPEDAGRLARVLAGVDAVEAERLLRGAMDAAAGTGDYLVASAAAGDLFNLLMMAGRLTEALAVADRQAEFTRRAGLGPWTRLADQGQRLQVLGRMGEHARVLGEIETLLAAMAELPARRGANDPAIPWNVREFILNTGHDSALAMGDLQRCLGLNAEIAASMRQRGAGEHEVTGIRYNDAGPLIRLGRLAEAGRLLAECQRVFEDHANAPMLARVLSTRASLEDELGHRQAAADLQRVALRLRYPRLEPRGIAVGHHNLANYLGLLGGDRAGQRAHRLAAALIRQLSGMAHDLAGTVRVLAAELRDGDPAARLPATVAQVVAAAELTEGVRLGALLAALQPDPQAVEEALAEILRAAAESPPREGEPDTAALLREWEPVIAAIAAVCQTGEQPPPQLAEFLDEGAKRPEWSALVAVLRRLLAGERDQSALLAGLDPVDTAIARETLRRLEQQA
jgi:tetratricopeptide (TPR) repeat protein